MALWGRLRQVRQILREGGTGALRERLRRFVRLRLGPVDADPRMAVDEVADSRHIERWQVPRRSPDGVLRIGWICTPPSPSSGGHTTMMRMITGLEAAGHHCSLHLWDQFHGDLATQTAAVRRTWPAVGASVSTLSGALPDKDVWIATSWQTAHVLARHPEASGHRCYFVQDFEPYFYAQGARSTLAEDTYRFGFHGITAGGWLSDLLHERYAMTSDPFEFGADTDVYRLGDRTGREGVVFYTRADVPRRGYELGVHALELFSRENPGVPIHVFGGSAPDLPFPAIRHGRRTPAQLNLLYNSCAAGLSLSFSNVSLIPWELLAAGCTPVVNDAPHNRAVLRNPHVRWSEPTPRALADALTETVSRGDLDGVAARASQSVAGTTWEAAAATVVRALERVAAR